jgi:poly(beta-D-mannuronate) lyase
VFVFSLCTSAHNALAEEYLVKTQAEFWAASEKLLPGDEIILGNGIWKDFEILFEGRGLAGAPITLRAETRGKTVITGVSSLALAGEYLIVSGLVFRDGYTPSQSVISFRKSKGELANNSRVTQTVFTTSPIQSVLRRITGWPSMVETIASITIISKASVIVASP